MNVADGARATYVAARISSTPENDATGATAGAAAGVEAARVAGTPITAKAAANAAAYRTPRESIRPTPVHSIAQRTNCGDSWMVEANPGGQMATPRARRLSSSKSLFDR